MWILNDMLKFKNLEKIRGRKAVSDMILFNQFDFILFQNLKEIS